MPKYSDLFAKQPAPGRGGRLSALSQEELQAYVDDVAPTFAQRFGNEVRKNAPPNYETGTLIDRGQRDLARMGQPMTLDQAAVATAGVPILGDAVGLAADAKAVYDDPSWMNIGGAALGALPFVPAMAAIRAYHGSPHDFDKFDVSKIGTGEGAQAYGHGLYFAEAEDTAKSYRTSNSATANMRYNGKPIRDEIKRSVAWYLDKHKGDKAAILDEWRKMYKPEYFDGNLGKRELRELERMDYSKLSPGHMYEVNINADPEDFLDYDVDLVSQGGPVRAKLEGLGYKADTEGLQAYDDALLDALMNDANAPLPRRPRNPTGSDILTAVGESRLREAGIPGIRYLDQGSRAAGEGSRNYVVFDDALIDIIRKYGIGALLGGAGAFGLMSLQGGEDGAQPPL